jgi:hypothetical protein
VPQTSLVGALPPCWSARWPPGSGSKKKEPRCACLIEAKTSHRQRMWAEVSSSAPHFLLAVSHTKWSSAQLSETILVTSQHSALNTTGNEKWKYVYVGITDQHYALIITPLLITQATTCFGTYMPSSGSVLYPSELLERQKLLCCSLVCCVV